MTIGKSSKKNKAPHSPPFLVRANGFYGRLNEMVGDDVQVERKPTEDQIGTLRRPETRGQIRNSQHNTTGPSWIEEDDHVFDFNLGMIDDDRTNLLKRKPSRLSQRWTRKCSRKEKYDKSFSAKESEGTETEKSPFVDPNPEVPAVAQTLEAADSREAEPALISVRGHVDNQILISGKRECKSELEDTRKEKKTDGKLDGESMEDVKRNTLKNYHKALDRAFRRGWETFVANLYSVTLTPISSTSSSSSLSDKTKMNRNRALAEFR
ncbi:uncharacterized protein LOC127649298 [Xyrauchen texanus]|uniref:uncharacterized protein LOC127649298 n=1 Tax=Xyrauchen texanus TaxID=154827 RepID=UPI0022422ECD|nr:uncharacterized protein LOC127649298 [Xyrauchen texanus]XP_051990317.1 uncharacterized protein LOC127649298 [Xyrauchen texanus]XP_051990325.1 uncharacterized protein LOC127649298 [Xyrauchen texanus]